MQIKLIKSIFFFFLISMVASCETIDKKVTEKTDKENQMLSKYLGVKSEVVKKDFGEPNKINLETTYKIYVYTKTNMLITCTREFFINPKTDVVEKFKSQNCIK
jgi:hypothetical protein